MINIDIHIQSEDLLKKLINNSKGVMTRALKLTALNLKGELKRNAPVDHGRLHGSFHIKKLTNYKYEVYTNIEYASYINDGTGVYVGHGMIYPTKAKVLYFKKNGQNIFIKSSKGQKGQKFMEKSIEETKQRMEELLQRAIREQLGVI